jgi:hypothetical protein
MRYANRRAFAAAAAMLGGWSWPAAAGPESPTPDVVAGDWQHHKVTMNYFGITSLYTCDGLESHVREILLYFGARKDLKVTATGCPGPFNAPSRTAWVNADFYSLAPAAAAGTPGAVNARWTALKLDSMHPSFMGEGDCELIATLKDLALKNFSLRDVAYRTDCVAHEVMVDSFSVTGQALKEAAPAAQARLPPQT